MDQSADAAQQRRLNWVSRAINHQITQWVPSPQRLAYRARIRLAADRDGQLGFHPPRSPEVLPITQCAVAHTALHGALASLPTVPRGVAHLELRTDGQRVVAAFESHHGGQGDVRDWLSELPPNAFNGADLAVDGKRVRGSCHVEVSAGDITHHLSPGTFYQVNLDINERLVTDVRSAVLARAPSHVLDAYAGAGNLSMPLAAQGISLTQIEQHPSAVRDAKATAERYSLNLSTRQQRAQSFQAGDVFFDLAILDPPRAGVGKMMAQLLLTRPASLIMVSCNPTTLGRDLRAALKDGFKISEATVYEMFPQTEHAEVMVILDR